MASITGTRNPSHLLVPLALLAVVLLMVVPLPPLLLDLLLSIDIGLAVVLLLTVVYVKNPVEFSVFPSLLLLLTLLRLSLNVAATRLILTASSWSAATTWWASSSSSCSSPSSSSSSTTARCASRK